MNGTDGSYTAATGVSTDANEKDQKKDGIKGNSGVSTNFGPCDPEHVLLRLEYCKEIEVKALVAVAYITLLVSVVPFVITIIYLYTTSTSAFFTTRHYNIAAAVSAGIVLAIEIGVVGYCFVKTAEAKKKKLIWTYRRQRMYRLLLSQQSFAMVTSVMSLVLNMVGAIDVCPIFNATLAFLAFMRYFGVQAAAVTQHIILHTLMPWKPGKKPVGINRWLGVWPKCAKEKYDSKLKDDLPMVLDLPMWFHMPKIMLGMLSVVPLCFMLYATLDIVDQWREQGCQAGVEDFVPSCAAFGKASIVQISMAAVYVLSFVIYAILLKKCARAGRQEATAQYRVAKVALSMQVRVQSAGFLFTTLYMGILVLVTVGTCGRIIITWYYGLISVEMVQGVFKTIEMYLFSPTIIVESDLSRLWCEEVCWREDVSEADALAQHLEGQESFCFETLLKLIYWSMLVYCNGEVEGPLSKYHLQTALKMYNLSNHELIFEPSTDTRALMAWNSHCLLLSFRGTSTMENVKSDMRVVRDELYPDRFPNMGRDAVLVHSGFLKAWRVNDLHTRILARVKEMMQINPNMKMYFTGHSLGGALACLCAFDVSLHFDCPRQIVCYTFGSPRVGNHSYCRMYNSRVPNTWRMVNGQDVVARRGKLLWKYKHSGSMVLIDKRGNMLVRPTFLERKAWQSPGAINVRDHLLTTYVISMKTVIAEQLTDKALHGGQDAIQSLLQDDTMREVLRDIFDVTGEESAAAKLEEAVTEDNVQEHEIDAGDGVDSKSLSISKDAGTCEELPI